MKNKSYILNGKRYRIEFAKLRGKNNGYCDNPNSKSKKIRIHERRASKRLLEDLLHEMLHACNWDAAEEWVTDTAHSLANVLWDQGYRLEKENEKGTI